jgi:hypothetical protein
MEPSHTKSESIFCAIAGCTDHAMTQRWIVMGDGSQRQIEVCWKHSEGEIDAATVVEPAPL